jgi:RNA polymerase sigma factor (sigma-70 family)
MQATATAMTDTSISADAPDRDRLLLQRFVSADDRVAVEEIFRRHVDGAWRFARRLVPDSDADDVVQAAFMTVMSKARSFRGESSVRTWLIGIVLNECRMHLRARRRRHKHERDEPAAGAHPPSEQLNSETKAAVRAALNDLPERYRAPLVLRFIEGFEFAAIAAAVGKSENTVRSQASRGLEKLRVLLVRRSVTLTSTALVSLLSEQISEAAPASLLASALVVAKQPVLPALPVTLTVTALLHMKLVWIIAFVALATSALFWRPGSVPHAVLPDKAQPFNRPIADLLDYTIDESFRHALLPAVLDRINQLVPPGRFLAYAMPPRYYDYPWAGVSIAGRRTVRALLDDASDQLGLRWRTVRDVIVFDDPKLITAVMPSGSAQERAAELRAASRRGSVGALRLLFEMMLDDDSAESKPAAEAIIAASWGWVTALAPRRSFALTLAEDPIVERVVQRLHRDGAGADDLLLRLCGDLRASAAVPWLMRQAETGCERAHVIELVRAAVGAPKSRTGESALKALGAIADGRVIEALTRLHQLPALHNDQRGNAVAMRSSIVQALCEIGDPRGAAAVADELRSYEKTHGYPFYRGNVVDSASRFSDAKVVDAFLELLANQAAHQFDYEAIRPLNFLRPTGAAPILEAYVLDKNLDVQLRYDSIHALAACHKERALDTLMSCYDSANHGMRWHVLMAMHALRGPLIVEALGKRLASADMHDRAEIARAMLAADADAGAEALRDIARDRVIGLDEETRLLVTAPDAEALIAMATNPTDPRMRVRAIQQLMSTHDARALDLALEISREGDLAEREAAVYTLDCIRDERARAALKRSMREDPAPSIRLSALVKLIGYDHEYKDEVVGLMLEALDSGDQDMKKNLLENGSSFVMSAPKPDIVRWADRLIGMLEGETDPWTVLAIIGNLDKAAFHISLQYKDSAATARIVAALSGQLRQTSSDDIRKSCLNALDQYANVRQALDKAAVRELDKTIAAANEAWAARN